MRVRKRGDIFNLRLWQNHLLVPLYYNRFVFHPMSAGHTSWREDHYFIEKRDKQEVWIRLLFSRIPNLFCQRVEER